MYKVGTVYRGDTNLGEVLLTITRVTKTGIDFIEDYEGGSRVVGKMQNAAFENWCWRNEATVVE